MVWTTGFAVSWTGATGTAAAGAVSAAAPTGAVAGAVVGARWMTTCTGGAMDAGVDGTVGVTGTTESFDPLTGLSRPRTVTMPSIVVAPRPAARMRLPWATCRRRRLDRFDVASPAEGPAAAPDRRARSCATRSSWSVFAAAGMSSGSPVGSVEVGSVIVFTALVFVFVVFVFVFVFVFGELGSEVALRLKTCRQPWRARQARARYGNLDICEMSWNRQC